MRFHVALFMVSNEMDIFVDNPVEGELNCVTLIIFERQETKLSTKTEHNIGNESYRMQALAKNLGTSTCSNIASETHHASLSALPFLFLRFYLDFSGQS